MDNPSHHRRYSNRNADIGRYWSVAFHTPEAFPATAGTFWARVPANG
jgi:hypothetical protein